MTNEESAHAQILYIPQSPSIDADDLLELWAYSYHCLKKSGLDDGEEAVVEAGGGKALILGQAAAAPFLVASCD